MVNAGLSEVRILKVKPKIMKEVNRVIGKGKRWAKIWKFENIKVNMTEWPCFTSSIYLSRIKSIIILLLFTDFDTDMFLMYIKIIELC